MSLNTVGVYSAYSVNYITHNTLNHNNLLHPVVHPDCGDVIHGAGALHLLLCELPPADGVLAALRPLHLVDKDVGGVQSHQGLDLEERTRCLDHVKIGVH